MSRPRPDRATAVIGVVAVGAILVLGLVGSIAGLVTPGPTPEPAPTYAGARPGDVAGRPGATLHADGFDVTASPLTTSGDRRCTTVTLAGTGTVAMAHDPAGWRLEDSSGSHGVAGSDDGSFHLGGATLTPGSTTSGRICFASRTADGTAVLHYDLPEGRLVWVRD